MKKHLIPYLIFCLACSVNSNECENKKNVVDDSSRVFKTYRFNDGGHDSAQFIGKIEDGLYFLFRADGSLETKANFVKGKQDGEVYGYHQDGQTIKSKCQMYNWKRVGEAFYYRKNGKLEEYEMHDGFGNYFFELKYDSITGQPHFKKGSIVSPKVLVDKEKYYVNDSFLFSFFVAQPPNTIQKVYSGKKGKRLDSLAIKNNLATYKGKFTNKGLYTHETVMELFDLKGNPLKKIDTTWTDFYVND